MLLVIEDMPVNLLSSETSPIEGSYVKTNLHIKWVVGCSDNIEKSNICKYLPASRKDLDLYSTQYKNYIVLGNQSRGTKTMT